MSKKIQHNCDLCEMDGEENIKAIAWYTAKDDKDYDVCRKHLKLVEEVGMPFHYY